jgi:hypothetical protein
LKSKNPHTKGLYNGSIRLVVKYSQRDSTTIAGWRAAALTKRAESVTKRDHIWQLPTRLDRSSQMINTDYVSRLKLAQRDLNGVRNDTTELYKDVSSLLRHDNSIR